MDDQIVTTDADMVGALVAEQHPDLAGEPVQHVASGWDNDTYRLGERRIVRLPRRAASATLLANEQRWLSEFAGDLPLPVPVPIRVGEPGLGYPFAWSICDWLPGEIVAETALDNTAAEARRLGEFLAALHQPAPAGLAPNPYRGVDLAIRAPIVGRNLETLSEAPDPVGTDPTDVGPIDTTSVARLFAALAETPAWSGVPLRLHGDLHTANVLADRGQISAVIDWGDVCSGDPACDLAIAWMLFDQADRETFRVATACDDATWCRAAGWALAFGVVYVANESLSARMATIGRTLVETMLNADDCTIPIA